MLADHSSIGVNGIDVQSSTANGTILGKIGRHVVHPSTVASSWGNGRFGLRPLWRANGVPREVVANVSRSCKTLSPSADSGSAQGLLQDWQTNHCNIYILRWIRRPLSRAIRHSPSSSPSSSPVRSLARNNPPQRLAEAFTSFSPQKSRFIGDMDENPVGLTCSAWVQVVVLLQATHQDHPNHRRFR